MSTLKADTVTSSTTNGNLSLTGHGTGGVKVTDYFIQTKGSDISSATSLTLGKDGNFFDVTGTTTITSIGTQGIGSHITLQFDGALTFTHHSTDLILPGAANITTAAGDIAVMYEYASADWRCVSYTKASGAAVVAGGLTLGTEQATTSGSTVTFSSIPSGTKMIIVTFEAVSSNGTNDQILQIGDSGGLETSAYFGHGWYTVAGSSVREAHTDGYAYAVNSGAGDAQHGSITLTLKDSTNNTWVAQGMLNTLNNVRMNLIGGSKSLSGELTQLAIVSAGTFDAGSVNIAYQ